MSIADELTEKFWSEEDVARLLRLSVGTLRGRRSRGTNHPPYISVRRGVVLYPKDMLLAWLEKQSIIHEVKSAS